MIRTKTSSATKNLRCDYCHDHVERTDPVTVIVDGSKLLAVCCSNDCALDLIQDWKMDAEYDSALGLRDDSPALDSPWWEVAR